MCINSMPIRFNQVGGEDLLRIRELGRLRPFMLFLLVNSLPAYGFFGVGFTIEQVVTNDTLTCYLTGGSSKTVHCAQFDGRTYSYPSLKNPRKIDLNSYGDRACAIDDEGLKCWEVEDSSEFESSPQLIKNSQNAKDLSARDYLCIIDDKSTKCDFKSDMGRIAEIDLVDIKHHPFIDNRHRIPLSAPRKMTTGPSILVVDYGDKIIVFDKQYNSLEPVIVPGLKDVSYLFTHTRRPFAVSEGKVYCYDGTLGWDREFKDLEDVKQVAVWHKNQCALTSKNLYCTGTTPQLIPDLVAPTKFSMKRNRVCVVTKSGVKCFFHPEATGSRSTFELPKNFGKHDSNRTDSLDVISALGEIAEVVYPHKSDFIHDIANLVQSKSNSAQLGALLLLKPFLQNVQAKVVQSSVLPDLKIALSWVNQNELKKANRYIAATTIRGRKIRLEFLKFIFKSIRSEIGNEVKVEIDLLNTEIAFLMAQDQIDAMSYKKFTELLMSQENLWNFSKTPTRLSAFLELMRSLIEESI